VLTIRLAVFGLGGNFDKSSFYGILMTFGALFFDAVYVPMVDKMKVGTGGAFVTMLFSQMWSVVFTGLLSFKEIWHSLRYLNGGVFVTLLGYGITGGAASASLFAAIELSDGLVLAIATTCRKFCTIVLSAIAFRHNLNVTQWIGVVIVFTALGIEIGCRGRGR
jgi:UDP-galactose transporter B1